MDGCSVRNHKKCHLKLCGEGQTSGREGEKTEGRDDKKNNSSQIFAHLKYPYSLLRYGQ